ncbi:MAG: hypothetical protein WCG91_03290 [Candidatus Shapirobacteria bacterium]
MSKESNNGKIINFVEAKERIETNRQNLIELKSEKIERYETSQNAIIFWERYSHGYFPQTKREPWGLSDE